MTASRAEIGLAFLAMLFAGAAAAQTPPQPESPPASAPVPESTAAPANNTPIEVNPLGSPDGPAVGLLDLSNGGMSGDIWSGSDRAAVEELLTRVPLATPVYSVRTLARKLLLTVADAPVGQAPHAFQTVRLGALLSAGLVPDAAKLATQIELKDDPEFARAQAVAILLGGTPADACGNATAARAANPEAMWMQLRAYCYAAAGQTDLLELTRGVMKAQGSDDKAFETLLSDVLTRKSVAPGDIHDPTPVDLFLLRQAGLPISTAFAARFGEAAAMVALHNPKNPPGVRADAAAQTIHTGWVSSGDLAAVADVQSFTPQQFANAESAATGLPFFLGQALVRQAVARSNDNDEKTRLLAVALRTGREMQLLTVAVRMQQKAIASLAPGPHDHAHVSPFARALMLAREADAAERWKDSLDPKNDDRPLAAALTVELALVSPNPGRMERAQAAIAWLAQNAASLQPQNGPDEQRFDTMAVLLWDALGGTLPPGVSMPAVLEQKWPGRVIPPATVKRLDELKDQKTRKGEAILILLDAVGVLGPGDLSPEAAAYLVRYLKSVGEPDAARALAIDALLLYQSAS